MTPEELDQVKRERDAWKDIAEGRSLLLVAYRTGGQPPERAFTFINRGREVLDSLGKLRGA